MHTSAHPTPPPAAPVLQFCGHLLADAEVRVKPVGNGGQMMAVLCLEIRPDNSNGLHVIHAEQVFPTDSHCAVTARAHQLKRGMHIELESPAYPTRLVLPHCHHIRVLPAATNQPTAQP